MVGKMMRWGPWPPLVTKKYEVMLIVRRMEGCDLVREEAAEKGRRVMVEVRWKGPKLPFMSSLRRTAEKRNFTREVVIGELGPENGGVEWNEEFQSVCSLSAYKENVFHPWKIGFTVFDGLSQGTKVRIPIFGTASLNLAEYACTPEHQELELKIPLALPGVISEPRPVLCVSVSLLELRATKECAKSAQRAIVPVPSPLQTVEAGSSDKDELSPIKAGLRKVKIFTDYVSTKQAKKPCREDGSSESRDTARSEDEYPFDSDLLDDFEEGESDEIKDDSTVRKPFSYGTLAYANCAIGSFQPSTKINAEDEDWVYYSSRKSAVGCSDVEESIASVSEPSCLLTSKRSLLPWRKRKLSFRSPKSKGEPLLKKTYGEEGGDDIDFDRRQLGVDESLALGWHKTNEDSSGHHSPGSEFGEDNFSIGSWENKEVISRDGHLKLQTQVFFASIDQRSERAAGESACTALVAVIADWFQSNRDLMPIKSQFDTLIREGSLEWRNLCQNEAYRERFPDKHFDLDTVLEAKIRPLYVLPGKSFIGFFHPEGMDEGRFDFLHGAMSFDNIWDEISRGRSECPSNVEPQVYIISWNDHFFILKIEQEAYYIIDTLGERLYEGCKKAYILKFDSDTVIYELPESAQASDANTSQNQQTVSAAASSEQKNHQAAQANVKKDSVEDAVVTKNEEGMKTEEVMCRGKEACKEYIKSFLAAIPIRELQVDIKKGLMASTPLHHRLQIECHYTQVLQPKPETVSPEASIITGISSP